MTDTVEEEYADSRYVSDDWGHRTYIFLTPEDAPPANTGYAWEHIGFAEDRQRRIWRKLGIDISAKVCYNIDSTDGA
jgi:hypothetical protein